MAQTGVHGQLDMYQYCEILSLAYQKSFTRENIVSPFRRSGLWPLDLHLLLNFPLPWDANALDEILGPAQLIELLESKRKAPREEILGAEISVLRNDSVDTKRGAALTSEAVLDIARKKVRADKKKREAERLAAIR